MLDLRVLEEMSSLPGRLDDPALVRLIGLFIGEEQARVALLRRLAADRDRTELGRAAHKLAGSCAVIGAGQACQAARDLERLAAAAAWGEIAGQLAAVEASWALLLGELGRHKLVRA